MFLKNSFEYFHIVAMNKPQGHCSSPSPPSVPTRMRWIRVTGTTRRLEAWSVLELTIHRDMATTSTRVIPFWDSPGQLSIMVIPCPETVRALTWEMKPPAAWECDGPSRWVPQEGGRSTGLTTDRSWAVWEKQMDQLWDEARGDEGRMLRMAWTEGRALDTQHHSDLQGGAQDQPKWINV